ncbi:MAG: KR domain-containing protein, partial [Candidatus Thorarchaeota archaeon]
PQAIGIAEDWIRNGRCKRVIVITADNVTSNNLFQWIGAGFIASGAATIQSRWEDAVLPFGEGRNGIILGAGASAFVIEQQPEAEARGIKPIVEILGSYFANSAFHGTRLDSEHISQKLRDFVLEIERKHGINRDELAKEGIFVSHETYSPARGGSAESELRALENAFGKSAYDMVIMNTKGYTGHAMGAGIEEAVAIKSLEKGKIPPIANMKKIDPKYSKFNFSKGMEEKKKFALRFAAGFGSQLAIVLFRLVSSNHRVMNANYENWLQSIGGGEKFMYMDGRILKMKTKNNTTQLPPKLSTEVEKIPQSLSSNKPSEVLNELKMIISSKTGYDPENIEETYDLEEDLGIDTVKQAEIFGEIREKWDINIDDSFNMADYRTINAIAQLLNKLLEEDLTPLEVNPSFDDKTLEDELIKLISDKTGYDIEDIDIEFDLEEDLGIDTVKQAEIFGELRNKLNISEDTEINLVGLGCIKNIIQKIQELMIEQKINLDAVYEQNSSISYSNEQNDMNQVNDFVKKCIAEKTGYDITDIEDSYDLEEDLGIDTVKQAEIFGELRSYYQIRDSIEINISEIHTLKDITTFIMQIVNDSSISVESNLRNLEDIGETKEISQIGEREAIFVSQVIPSRVFNLTPVEKTSKFNNIDALILNINSALKSYENLSKNFEKLGIKNQIFHLNSNDDSNNLLKNNRNGFPNNKEFKIIILVVPDNTHYSIDDSLLIFDKLFIIFQSIKLSVIEKILVISPETIFGWKEGANPLSASIGAFIKTINREFKIPIKLISSIDQEQILQEFLIWDNVEEIAYDGNIRYTLLRKKIEIPEHIKLSVSEEDVFLVTGGAQGITFACIDELTNHIKPQLILLGLAPYDVSLIQYLNSPSEILNEKKEELIYSLKSKNERVTPVMINKEWKKFLDKLDTLGNIEHLRKKGLSVQYYEVDVTNGEKMNNIFQEINDLTKNSKLSVIHGAGIEESKSFLNKNLNVAHKVVDVKVGGLSNILRNLNLENIKYIIAFSSIAGRYGNRGQIDYAFANAYLSRIAWKFNQEKIPFLTFDWTAWADIGMATQGSTLQILTQAGVTPIPAHIGVKIFSKLILNNLRGEYLIAGDLGIFEEMLDIEENINKTEYPMLERINFKPEFILGVNTLNSEFDRYLLDHQIQKKSVFPGVMVLETFAEFYNRVFDKPMTSISDVNFHTPLKIPTGKTIEIGLILNKSRNEIQLNSKTFPKVLKGKPLIKEHFNARFDEPIKKLIWKKESISEPMIPLLNGNEIYEVFFHGKTFQVLKDIIQLEKETIVSKVKLPTENLTSNKKGDNFQLDPLAIESVFQSAALYDFIIHNHISLPSKIGSLKILTNQEPKYIVAKFIKTDDERSQFNSIILSENQEIIAEITNLELIHSPIMVDISQELSDYLTTIKEYYFLKNNRSKPEILLLPIAKIKQLYQTEPKFLQKYLTAREFDNSKRFRNSKRLIEYFSGILAAKEVYLTYFDKDATYQDFEIQKDENGKPFYFSIKENQKIPLYLSISHSHEFSTAIISKKLVGIDLEIVEPRSSSFYKEVFTDTERQAISEDPRLGTIYWTAKEAFSKAIGEGLKINFRDIELNYNKKEQKFTLKFNNGSLDFSRILKNIQLKVESTNKYILSYCEITPFKYLPLPQ